MESVTGVFNTRADAEHAYEQLKRAGIPADKITVLTPGSQDHMNKEIQTVPTDATEQPGMGTAVGALLGGGVGITGGSVLMALVPGVGPITALGLLGAAILGAAGATVGAVAGGKIEKASYDGLPEDEIFLYEDALRKGRSVLIAAHGNKSKTARLLQIDYKTLLVKLRRYGIGLRRPGAARPDQQKTTSEPDRS